MVRRTLFLALAVTAGSLFAQGKLVILNTQQAMLDTAEIKKAQGALEAKFKPRQVELQTLEREISELQSQAQTGQAKLTQAALQDIGITAQRKQREMQRKSEDLQGEVDRERNDILQRTGARMQDIVRKLAEEKGYDIIVDQSNTVYFKPALDITKEVTAAYDKLHPAQ